MHPILRKLEGGDRRSIGRSAEVVAEVLENPGLFKVLVHGLSAADAVVRMRAADAMEKASSAHPELLRPHKDALIELADRSGEAEVRWHLAQVLPRLELSPKERRRVVATLLSWFGDRSSIVRTCAMQALADFAGQDPGLRPSILVHLRELTVIGTPAMKARGRKLLATLEGPAVPPARTRRKPRAG